MAAVWLGTFVADSSCRPRSFGSGLQPLVRGPANNPQNCAGKSPHPVGTSLRRISRGIIVYASSSSSSSSSSSASSSSSSSSSSSTPNSSSSPSAGSTQKEVKKAFSGGNGGRSGTGLGVVEPPTTQQPQRQQRQPCFGSLAVAAQCLKNDADFVARGLSQWDTRARQDVELLRTQMSVLDARAREDAEILDSRARHDMRRLRKIALGIEEAARLELTRSADEHWKDGALANDLQIADARAKRRALEDAYAAWQVAKKVHAALVRVLRTQYEGQRGSSPASSELAESARRAVLQQRQQWQQQRVRWQASDADTLRTDGGSRLEYDSTDWQGAVMDSLSRGSPSGSSSSSSSISSSRSNSAGDGGSAVVGKGVEGMEGASGVWSAEDDEKMEEALRRRRRVAEFEELLRSGGGLDILQEWSDEEGNEERESAVAASDSEELEFVLAALLDLDEVSSGSGALLLADSLDSPDVAIRKAIVDVLAAAPSLWALGNAGVGALQKLSNDSNPLVAGAAATALDDLRDKFEEQQQKQAQAQRDFLSALEKYRREHGSNEE